MNNFILRFIFKLANWLIITFVFSGCAQIVNPSGGPKDTKPPRAVKYIPDSAAKKFSSKNIAIVFDEYIQVADLQKQLIISPPLKNQPEVKVKGRTLFIELKDTLKKNTTYTFNFGNSIVDYTEGNKLEDFQYIFSTGDFIDSLKLSGNVKNAFDGKPEKGVVVMLYDAYGDSLPYKKVPSYFAKTKDDGSYKINNIKAGTYKAFALKDINSNFLFDSPDELIGFSDTLIKITKKTSLNFILFKEIPYKQKLKKASVPEHGHLVFAFAKPVSDSLKLNFISQEPKENVIYEYSNEKDTLHYWFADDLKDTMKIILTDGKKFKDTVRLKPITLEQAKTAKRGEKWQLKVKMNVSKDKLFDLNKEIEIRFNHPLNESLIKHKEKYFEQMDDFDKVLIKEDSTTCDSCEIYAGNKHSLGPKVFGNADALFIHRVIREYSESKTSNDVKTAGWSFGNRTWKENTRYNIFVPPATVTDIFGLINDTIKIDFKTQEEKYYGTLKLNFKIKIKKFILQLVNEKGEVFEEEDILSDYDKGIFYYKYLPPGTYNLRVIYDTNGDGLWTTGNYLKKQQPEKIIYYSKPITIRSNWDLEMEWKVE